MEINYAVMIVGLSVLFKYLYPLKLHRTADSSLTTIEHQTNVLKTMFQIEVHNFFFNLRDRPSQRHNRQKCIYSAPYTLHLIYFLHSIYITIIAMHVYHHFIVIFSTLKLIVVFFKKYLKDRDNTTYCLLTL